MNALANANTMSSREIAELISKPHNDIMKAIRKMMPAWNRVNGGKFSLVDYKDAKGELRPMFLLTKLECLYIATKFNDEARARLVIRWSELEEHTLIDFTDANQVVLLAQNWAVEQKKRKIAEKQVRLLLPKAQLMDRVLDADEKIDIGQAAKILELPFGRNTMFKKLREKGVFFKNKNEPKQTYIKRGLFVLKEKWIERSNHEGFVVVKVLVTQRGLEFISKLFDSRPQCRQTALLQ